VQGLARGGLSGTNCPVEENALSKSGHHRSLGVPPK
jgi:hypothetical protein